MTSLISKYPRFPRIYGKDPLPLQIQALSQKLILTSISEDVSARVQAFELG